MQDRLKKIRIYVLVVLIIFLPGIITYYSLARQKQVNHNKLLALKEENKKLIEENKKLKDDPVYIEKVARENLGLAKKGEYVVKFVDQDTKRK